MARLAEEIRVEAAGGVGRREIILGVNLLLGNRPLSACTTFDSNHDGQVTVNGIVLAVSNALNGCLT